MKSVNIFPSHPRTMEMIPVVQLFDGRNSLCTRKSDAFQMRVAEIEK